MLRLHFTLGDLARVRVAPLPYPQVEAVLALQRLQGTEAGVLFDGWRRRIRAAGAAHPALARLFDLVPAYGAIPSFLLPGAAVHDAGGWLDRVLATPRPTLRYDLERYTQLERRPIRGWVRELADGDRAGHQALESALRAFLRVGVEPVWAPAVASVTAERAGRARDLLDGGLDQLLGGLPGVARWEPPTLVTSCPADQDIYLDGRGLVLAPSYFCWPWSLVLHSREDPDPPLLIYPVRHRQLGTGPAGPGRSLAAALGGTRAAVLELVAESVTTGELARRLGISPATASWHVAALREAGLVSTQRNRYATHTLTGPGRHLLDQPGAPDFRASSNIWTPAP